MEKKIFLFLGVFVFLSFFVCANYFSDVYFTMPDTIYYTGERIELKGYVYQANFTSNTSNNASLPVSGASVNFTIKNYYSGVYVNNSSFTTDALGAFYSKSNYYTSSPEITCPTTAGVYVLRAQYIDPVNSTKYSEIKITVVNQSVDTVKISSKKSVYNPSENVKVDIVAMRQIGDKTIFISNVSINGTLRNSSKAIISSFNCTTGNNGKCKISLTAPSSYGSYILELGNFTAFSSFLVIPFSYTLYMKDELGKSLKNIYAVGEQAKVEVRISNASTNDEYSFSGYIADSAGNTVKVISSTSLTNNNSFTNSFLFTLDSLTFAYGAYLVSVTVSKTGGGSISAITSFQVEDWTMSLDKPATNSGFEYEYSAFPNKSLKFQLTPTYRSNGSVIAGVNSTSFSITLKDSLNNIFATANTSWNSTCGLSGCYDFNFSSPSQTGKYNLQATLSFGGSSQTVSRIVNVIDGVMSIQSTDKDGNLKELFGTNEYIYLTVSSYNATSLQFNLSDAEVFAVQFMNGTEFTYTNVSYELVNATNSNNEWGWNITSQRLRLDVPKSGGMYDVYVFGNNRSLGATAKFLINPYDVCSAAKNTPGSVSGASGYYYVWQFKSTDIVYFEIKMTQANNPLGRATASNNSAGNGTGMGAQCSIDTQTKQVVSNATITIVEVKNLESGSLQNLNVSGTSCQASDSSGGYTCTITPATKWESGQNIVKLNILGSDGTSSEAYSRFEARTFYLYGWSSNWQNNPTSNISLNVQMYEAGNGWWGGGGGGGLSGSVSVKRVEYQGRDGEWIWPPVDSGYNVSLLNSTSITGSTGYLTLPASNNINGVWKTGNYRIVLQATTSAGDVDYGYAWFGIKLWDVYGQPIECGIYGCNYKGYFNSKENISLYLKVSKAGSYNYYDAGGQQIYGPITVGIKKIQDCKKWPCRDLNSTEYKANTLTINQSSPWYWSASSTNQSNYILGINKTGGTWGTGYYNVVLDINGTDTGYAWFNTLSFYVETQPVNASGSYKYSIRGNSPMFFNVSTVKNYKNGYSYYNGTAYVSEKYNSIDFLNTTIYGASLRTWDSTTRQSKEYTYPELLNITPTSINGSSIINITFNNGTWPTGYYWGELNLRSADGDTSSGYIYFNVQPFRVQVSGVGSNSIDSDQCMNVSMQIYEPDWYTSTIYAGNYSIVDIYEDIWSGYGSSRTTYTNYSNSTFNGTTTRLICPNNGNWGTGNWGGWHYLNIIVRDIVQNDSQSGWLSFKTVPFSISWGSVQGGSYKATNEAVSVNVNLSRPSSGASARGNLTKIYQWRYDNYQSTKEEYIFKVSSNNTTACFSNVSSQCVVNGTQTVTIYPPSGGWKVGYNYLYAEWTKETDNTKIEDWGGIYFDGREAYNGYFQDSDRNGYWKHDFMQTENITTKLFVRDSSYNAVDVTITRVDYALNPDNCYSEYCRTYTSAVFSPTTTSSGNAILQIKVPSGGWTKGNYYIKATVSGGAGSAVILGGNVRIKDLTRLNISIISPINNQTYNRTISFNFTTTKNSQCTIYAVNFNNFNNWACAGWNVSNGTSNSTLVNATQTEGACNLSRYNYTGNSYYTDYVSATYHSYGNGSVYNWQEGNFVSTGGTSHSYTFNVSNWVSQHYGFQLWCNDIDYNSANQLVTIKVNNTG